MRGSHAADGRFSLFDGHRMLSVSCGSDLAELGYDSRARLRPQLNLIYAFSAGEGGAAPAYYKRYPGGTTDVAAFADLLAEPGIDASGCVAVADRGFASEGDFALPADMGLHYVMPLKRGDRLSRGRIPEGPGGRDNAFACNGRGISRMTIEEEGFNVHVYLDTKLYHHEFSDACARAEGESDSREAKRLAEERRRARGSGRLTDDELAALVPVDVAAALGDRSEMGTVTIRTDHTDLSARGLRGLRAAAGRQAVLQDLRQHTADGRHLDEERRGNRGPAVPEPSVGHGRHRDPGGDRHGRPPARRQLQGLRARPEEGQGVQDGRRHLEGRAREEEGRYANLTTKRYGLVVAFGSRVSNAFR